MNKIFGIIFSTLFILIASPAFSQCVGQFQSGQVCNNPTSGLAPPTAVFNPVFGNSTHQGSVVLYPGSGSTNPSSLQNGELWTNAVGVFAQINGATVGPFVASSGGGGGTLNDFVCWGSTPSTLLDCGGGFGTANTWTKTQTIQQLLEITNSAPLPTIDLQTVVPANGFYVSGSGAVFQNCPLIGCVSGDHQQSALYLKATATRDKSIAEYMATFDCNLNSGSTGTPVGISDAKVCVFLSSTTSSLAGNATWGMANDLVIGAGDTGLFKVNTELDITNNGADCAVGVRNCYALYLSGLAANPITSFIVIAAMGSTPNAHYGFLINGAHTADTADIEDSGGAAIGLSIGGLLSSSHSTASISDASTSPIGLRLNGTYATAAISGTGFIINPTGSFIGSAVGGQASAAVQSRSTLPGMSWDVTGQTADNKWWDILGSGTTFLFRAINDANSVSSTFLQASRSGTTISGLFYAANQHTFTTSGFAATVADYNVAKANAWTFSGTAGVVVNTNTTLPAANPTGTILNIVGAPATLTRISTDSYGSNGALSCRRADGTIASPSAVQTDELLCSFNAYAYGATAYSSGGRSAVDLYSAGIWTDASQPTYIAFKTTPSASTTIAEHMRIFASGGVSIGNTTDPGDTNLSVTGSFVTGSITSPTIFGGTAAGSSLTLTSTSNVSPSGDSTIVRGTQLFFQSVAGVNRLDFGSTTANAWAFHGTAGVIIDTSTGSMLTLQSSNTGANNVLNVFNTGTGSTSNTSASVFVQLTTLTNGLLEFQALGGATPIGRVFTLAGLTGGLSLISIAGPIITNAATTLQFQSSSVGVFDYGLTTGSAWTFGANVVMGGFTLYGSVAHNGSFAINTTADGTSTTDEFFIRGSTLVFQTLTATTTADFGITTANTWTFKSSAGVAMTTLPTSAGAGGVNVCIDTAGKLYKKAACP